jgi:signal transduction histidine kinase
MQTERIKPDEASRFRILTEISQQITVILDIDELLIQVVRLVQHTFNYYHVGIGLVEGNEVVYRMGAGELWDDPGFQFKPQRLKIRSDGITGWVAHTGKPVLASDVKSDPHYVWMQGSLTQSELTVPITVKGKMIGVLDVQSQHLDDFDQNDLELMQAIANQTGIAIENARLFAVTQRRAEQFRVLMDVSHHITSILDIDVLLKQLVQLIQRTFNYYHIEIGMIEGDEIVFHVGAGALWDGPNFRAIPTRLKVGSEGITGKVAATGKPLFAPDVSKQPEYVHVIGSRTKSELSVPIIVKGKVIGVLDVESDRLNDFDETDLEVIASLANQAGIAIENARLFAETQRLLKETRDRAGELGIINSVQQGLASKLDVQSIYELVGDTFHNFFNAQVVVISAYDARANTVEHRYAIERGRRVPWPGMHPPGGFRDEIIRTKKPFLVNTNVGETAARLNQPILQGTDTPRSWLGVPIMTGDTVTGILSVQNLDEENAFDESDVRLLQTFAASMSIALENARLYEQARNLAVLEERQRLARELHDSVTQSLYGISLYAQAAAGKITATQFEQAQQYIEDIQNTSQESLADMRLLIYELKPPVLEKEGLVAALQGRLNSVENRANIKSSIESDLTDRLAPDIEDGLYQIAREALNNIIKHAHATNVSIILARKPDSVSMEIFDDGVGFALENIPRNGCLGLTNMQEHAKSQGWNLKIETSPGNGTRVRVEIKQNETESTSS